MKKKTLILICFLQLLIPTSMLAQKSTDTEKITILLDNWHKAAGAANFNKYFEALTPDAIFIGTDATENWSKTEFEAFSKPFFDTGKAWDFKPMKRHIYLSKDKKTGWFDELLDTWMKVCRGSGVLVKVGKEWKIKQYVLSMTIPNDVSDAVIKIKTPVENPLIEKLKAK